MTSPNYGYRVIKFEYSVRYECEDLQTGDTYYVTKQGVAYSGTVALVDVKVTAGKKYLEKYSQNLQTMTVTATPLPSDITTGTLALDIGSMKFHDEPDSSTRNWNLSEGPGAKTVICRGMEIGTVTVKAWHSCDAEDTKDTADVTVCKVDVVLAGLGEERDDDGEYVTEENETSPGAFIALRKTRDLQINALPKNLGGFVTFSMGGTYGNRLKLYMRNTAGSNQEWTEVPGGPTWTWSTNSDILDPAKVELRVEGLSSSYDVRDVYCQAQWNGVEDLSASDRAVGTVVHADIANTGYSEPDPKEEDIGIFIHAKSRRTLSLNYSPSREGAELNHGLLKLSPVESEHIKLFVPNTVAGEEPSELSTFEWNLANGEKPPKNIIVEGRKYGTVMLKFEHTTSTAEDKVKITVFECRVEITADKDTASERLPNVVQDPGWFKFERKIKPAYLMDDNWLATNLPQGGQNFKNFPINLEFETVTYFPVNGHSDSAKFGSGTPSCSKTGETFNQFLVRKELGDVRPEFINSDFGMVAAARNADNPALHNFQVVNGDIDESSMSIRYKFKGQIQADKTVGMLRLDPIFDWMDEGTEGQAGEQAIIELVKAAWTGIPPDWDPLAPETPENGNDEPESKTTAKIEIKDGAILRIRTDSDNNGTINADDEPEVKNNSARPGRILRVNNDDDDKNGV